MQYGGWRSEDGHQMKDKNFEKFGSLTFDKFRRMAGDESLSKYEKIGFPNSYRAGKEEAIFE